MELKCYNSCHFRTTGYSFNRTAYGIEIIAVPPISPTRVHLLIAPLMELK